MTREAVGDRGLRSRGQERRRRGDGARGRGAVHAGGGQPATSTGISYSVEVAGQAPEADLLALVNHVDVIAEIPNSLRQGTPVTLDRVNVSGGS
ncbi:MAG TPA: hypothetical protein VIH64_03570 [Streptosporangiaceae bacterium]